MAVAFGSSSSTTYASRSSLTVTAPTGISNGDLLVAHILWAGNGTTITPPTGWTQVGSTLTAIESGSTFYLNSGIFKKIASGESGNYTWTPSATVATQGKINRYTGASGTINDYSSNWIGGTAGSPGNSNADATGITTTVNGCMLVYESFDWGDNSNNLTPPTSFTERVEVNPLIYSADMLQTTAGATGTVTHVSNSNASNPRGAWLIALQPANPAWNPNDFSNIDSFSTYQSVPNARATTGNHVGDGAYTITDNNRMLSVGKYYFEVDIINIDTTSAPGTGDITYFAASSTDAGAMVYVNYDNETNTTTISDITEASRTLSSAFVDGDNLGFAVDNVNKKIWFRVNGGSWQDIAGTSGNPSTNTNGVDYSSFGGTVDRLHVYSSRGNFDLGLRSNSSVYTAPSGFTYLDGSTPSSGGTGTLAVTEADDTLSSAGKLAIKGTLAVTESGDTLSSTATLAIKGTLAVTEAGDTLSSTGALAIKGTLSVTEAGDTLSATGGASPIIGTLSVTEANDTLSSTAKLSIAGTLSVTEAGDTLLSSAVLAIKGTLNVVEADDTLSAIGSGVGVITGSLFVIEQDDTLFSTTLMGKFGSADIYEEGDTLSSAGKVQIKGTASITEGDDTLSSQGKLSIKGTFSVTEENDTLSSTLFRAITGTVTITEGDDTLASKLVKRPFASTTNAYRKTYEVKVNTSGSPFEVKTNTPLNLPYEEE